MRGHSLPEDMLMIDFVRIVVVLLKAFLCSRSRLIVEDLALAE